MTPASDTFKCHEETEMSNDGNENTFSKRRIIKNLVVVSLGTFFVLAADDIMITMQSTLNSAQGVGVASVAVQYAFSFLTSLLLPKYMVLRYGYKTNIKIFIVMFIPFIVANYYPLYYLMILSSVSIGVGFSIFKGALDPYLNNLSRLYADLRIAEEKETNDFSRRSTSIELHTIFKPAFKTTTQDNSCNLDNELTDEQHTVYNFTNVRMESERDSSNYSTMEKCSFSDSCYPLSKEIVKGTKPKEVNVENFSKEGTKHINDLRISKKRKNNNLNQNNGITRVDGVVLKGNRQEDKSNILESTTIRFFGFHSLINMSCYVFSNLTSYFVLQNGYTKDFLSTSFANETCSCGAAYCSAETNCSEYNLHQPSTVTRNILISVCVGLWFLAAVIWIAFLDDLKQDKDPVSFSASTLLATFRHMKKKNQILLIPMTMNTGILIGFYVADFTKSYIACAWGIQFVGLVTACSGGAMAIVSVLSGWLAKPLGRCPIFISAAILNAALIAILLLWEPNSLNPAMFFVTAGMYGSVYGVYYTQIRAFYGVLFKEDEEAAFGAYQFWYSVGLCLSLSFSNYLCNDIKIYIFIVSCSLGLIGYLIVESSHSTVKKNASS